MLPMPSLRHFCDLHVELGPIREMGAGRAGRRRIIPIIGGRVEGPEISGRILNLGADWQTVFGDGVAELDTRYAFETDDGALIEIVNYGFRHGPEEVIRRLAAGEDVPPEVYYMRTHARLETGHPDYAWVNRMLFVGTGARFESAVRVSLFAVE
jgi:hypothetical protein